MRSLVSVLASMVVSGAVLGVSPVAVLNSSETDFAAGEFEGTVVTSLGEVRLGRQTRMLMPADEAPAAMGALAADGKVVYAASRTDTTIYRIADGKSAKFAKPPGTLVNQLVWTGKDLLAATGGEDAGVYRIDDAGKHTALWAPKDEKYVWAVVPVGEGFYAATGVKACVYHVDAQGKGELVYEAPEDINNILCLSRGADGTLYAGTDEKGLVVQIDPKAKTSRVLLDADEDEISAVIPDGAGGVFAATADQSRADGDEGASDGTDENGPDGLDINFGAIGMSAAAAQPVLLAEFGSQGAGRSAKAASAPASRPGKVSSAASRPARKSAPNVVAAGHRMSTDTGLGGEGNAVYHIGRDGLVKVIFRKPVVIHDMLLVAGKLLLGTGNDGSVYSVSPTGEEVTQLINTDAKQVTSLCEAAGGEVLFATANKGAVGVIESSMAAEGTYTSAAIDASQIARWGSARVQALAPVGARIEFSTRTGNVSEPLEKAWSQWSQPQPVGEGYLALGSPAGRFMQYRLSLKASPDGKSPVVRQVETVHQVGNLAPVIESVEVQSGSGGGPSLPMPIMRSSRASRSILDSIGSGPVKSDLVRPRVAAPIRRPIARISEPSEPSEAMPTRDISIDASDPNGDELVYAIYFRELGTEKWIKIADKLTDSSYSWDTRTVGDGKYEIKVVASDLPSNPPGSALEASKVSSVVVVDNTPPAFKELGAKVAGGTVTVTGLAVDAMSRIVTIHYSLDSAEEWTSVLPTDGICDSDSERFAFEMKDVGAGAHRIAVKVQDACGNVGYGTLNVTTGAGATSAPGQ